MELKTALSDVGHRKYQTKQEWVYSQLKAAIQTCALEPGARLVLDEVAKQLGVSRVPVREALLQLQMESLVEMTPHAGATVSTISLGSINDLFAILEELESLAVKAACPRATAEGLTQLEDLLTDMQKAVENGDLEWWSDLNTRFHLEISHASGMSLLPELTERVLEQWDRIRRYFLMDVLDKRVGQASEEHRRILETLRNGDEKAAARAITEHNTNALNAYLNYITSQTTSDAQIDEPYARDEEVS